MAPKQKGRPRKSCLEAAARARAGKNKVFILEPSPVSPHDSECTTWTGGVNHALSDSDDSDYLTEDESDSDSEDMDEVLVGLDKDEVLDGLRQECQMLRELDELAKPNLYDRILMTKSSSHWKKAEQNRALGYSGNSARRKRDQSEVICSTVGHLTEAGQTLEYGKNYEGYWTGELFVKQA